MFKEQKVITTEASELDVNNAVDLEWRKISDSGLLETMLSQVDSLHTSNSSNSGKYLKILFHFKKIIARYFIWHTFKIVAFFSSSIIFHVQPTAVCHLLSN